MVTILVEENVKDLVMEGVWYISWNYFSFNASYNVWLWSSRNGFIS